MIIKDRDFRSKNFKYRMVIDVVDQRETSHLEMCAMVLLNRLTEPSYYFHKTEASDFTERWHFFFTTKDDAVKFKKHWPLPL